MKTVGGNKYSCIICNRDTYDPLVHGVRKIWHTNCYVCTDCSKLGDSNFERAASQCIELWLKNLICIR